MHPKALLDACSELVRLTLKFDHPADAIVSRFFREHRGLGPRERATLAETVYTVLRKKLLFDHFAPSGSGPKERRLAILGFYGPGDFLRSALSEQEINWLDQCEKIKPEDLMERHRHNLPEWLVQPLKDQLGDGFWPLVESFNKGAGLDLRVNDFKAKRADVQKELAALGIKAVPTPYSPWGLRIAGKPALSKMEAFKRGDFEVQDEGSQLLAMLLDAKRGEMVVDFCAGAGGKTLAIGATMRSTGRLYAFDTSAGRLDAFKSRLARSGLSNVHPAAIAHERDERVKRLSGKIDRVLVDAPCTGMGTLRRNPDLKWRQNQTAVDEMTVKQTAILQSAARLLKSGGRLVYATCSVLPQENEAIALAFSEANPDFVPLDVGEVLVGLKVEQAASLCSGGDNQQRFLRLWPHRHQTDGFFAAVWQRQ
ncbi:RsmB/NOP family class I SAM-dependent RNA methyltransferase [Rhodoferax sp.]|jgi:16S rRNA (cytosine967-C5)-methyltransferase|uniref:RsmB/NOP family class I SAM-dependent RNA methyltransferase n=1 Tax=Rhodoferax sp. TaxID=50421 RepID=UPI002719A247|nr:RsmB/NOP family class I SAM-dependent RNA methyltransferase [Rhodoferax sp.]MDO9146023.1 RsmB/NOP family class I SAM-dependent RNA methyltransferase [Rhodoferax sp.]MDP1528135.1 RsmB/NOP family class I SAM-dependent RNA methyltransferase [Rhodoferax sp.]MDP1943157.1 RsmB/NOP family class I SAM-dependent RNA methyltransferase [Rhodoferax sp.]MDP2439983.1 RsmB/NOP family class I SAM-dependent RNA methyltransferase [Rhodoferax sp.]MDP3191935.1 RsmB/NOP family class I SAM-dependent RNA methyltr